MLHHWLSLPEMLFLLTLSIFKGKANTFRYQSKFMIKLSTTYQLERIKTPLKAEQDESLRPRSLRMRAHKARKMCGY